MNKQPEALRLADTFDHPLPPEWSDMRSASVELRRLHAENEALRATLDQQKIKSGGIPPNCKLVPVEPTQEMLDQLRFGWSDISTAQIIDRWKRTVDAAPHPPAVEQPQIDWQDMHLKEKRRAEMWIAKYEKDIGKLQVAVPVAAQPPSVAARTCANCLHNKPPFGNCDGCSQQNDDADDEGNWEPIPEPQGEQGTAAMAKVVGMDEYGPMLLWNRAWTDFPVGTKLYTHPQNLNCKSVQDRLATMWGYVKEQPKREPLTKEEIYRLEVLPRMTITEVVRIVERAHNIK